jgi:hypothetical protein
MIKDSTNVLPTIPSSGFSQNLCNVIKLIEYFTEACHRLLVVANTYLAASIYVSLGVVPLFVFLLYVLTVAAYTKL